MSAKLNKTIMRYVPKHTDINMQSQFVNLTFLFSILPLNITRAIRAGARMPLEL